MQNRKNSTVSPFTSTAPPSLTGKLLFSPPRPFYPQKSSYSRYPVSIRRTIKRPELYCRLPCWWYSVALLAALLVSVLSPSTPSHWSCCCCRWGLPHSDILPGNCEAACSRSEYHVRISLFYNPSIFTRENPSLGISTRMQTPTHCDPRLLPRTNSRRITAIITT